MTTPVRPPSEGWRAISSAPVLREEANQAPRLVGHFARFNTFNEIDSVIEGRFLERITPGAFRKTFAENGANIRMLLNHGKDPEVGDKPIGAPRSLDEDAIGPAFEGELFPSVPPLVLDGLRAGQYGVSYRFSVVREDWDPKPKRSDVNPLALPERTIREARVYEFGPTPFPADRGADIAVRSITDQMNPPEAPSLGAAETHPEPERRDDPAPIAAPRHKEIHTVEYVTREEKVARINELRAAIASQADEYPGVMPEDAQARWNTDNAEMDALRADVDALDARRARVEALSGNVRNVEAPAVIVRKTETDIYDIGAMRRESRTEEDFGQRLRDNAMRATETANYAHPDADVDKTRTNIARMLDHADTDTKELARRVLLTGSPTYRRAFVKYIVGQPLSPEEQRVAALTVQTDATGGFSVPFAFDPTLVHVGAHTAINPYRRACTVKTIVGTDTFHGVTAAAVTVARAAEAAAATEGGGAIGQISAIVGKVHGVVTASVELWADRPDIASEIASLIAEAKDNEEESIFTTGIGDALGAGYNPIGMLCTRGTSGAYTPTETATNNTFAIGDLYAVEAALPIRHRMGAAWFMGRATIRAAQAMETTGGQLFGGQNYASVGYPQNDPFGNTGLRLLNYPVWEVPSAPTGVADNAIIGALVNPSSFYVIERAGMTVEVIPHIFAHAAGSLPMGQRAVYAWWRNTAKPSNVDAGRTIAINPA